MVKLLLIVLPFVLLAACSPRSVSPTQPAGPAIVWQRSGGFAGICQRLTIDPDGSYLLQDCADESLIAEGDLSAEQWEQISPVLEQYGAVQYSIVPPEGTADMFTDEVTINGTGSDTPTIEEQAAISEGLAQLASALSLPGG